MRTVQLPQGWGPPPPQEWGAMPPASHVGRRLIWPVLMVGGLVTVLVSVAGRDHAPGLSARSWAAAALAAVVCWRLTAARAAGAAALGRALAEELVLVVLVVLVASPAGPLLREVPDKPAAAPVHAVTDHGQRAASAARARADQAAAAAPKVGRSALDNLLEIVRGAVAGAGHSPTTRKE